MSKRSGNFRRFLHYVRPYAGYIILTVIGGIIKFTLPLLIPQVTKHLLDDVYLNSALSTQAKLRELWTSLGGLMAAFVLIWAPWTYIRHYFAGKAGHRSVFDLRCELYQRILRMSASFFGRHKSGGIVARLINDISLAQNLVGTALTNIWMDAVSLLVILYFLLRIDLELTMVALATFPLYLFFFRRFGGRIREASMRVQEEVESLSGNVQEKIAGSMVVHAFNQEQNEQRNFARDSERLYASTMRTTYYQSLNMSLSGVLTHLAPLLVALFGGYRVITGGMTVGELVAVSMYLGPLYLPMQRFSELNVVFANSMAALDRIFEILDLKPQIKDAPDALDLPEMRGRVEFERVSFSYDGINPTLREISFTAEPGERIALVGQSGAGKTTIVSLIPRFYDADSGSIKLDGYDVRRLKLRSIRRQIGLVLQEPILFSGTIRENILYGNPEASQEDVVAACKAANAHDFIAALPEGYESEVGERGAHLSGGQRQRLTIARAFLRNPRLLILDEATSALDSESEHLVQEALERLMAGRTTFIIAHRLSTIINADRILVLQDGVLVESGSHAALYAAGGVYRRLFEGQFKGLTLTSETRQECG